MVYQTIPKPEYPIFYNDISVVNDATPGAKHAIGIIA